LHTGIRRNGNFFESYVVVDFARSDAEISKIDAQNTWAVAIYIEETYYNHNETVVYIVISTCIITNK
jgi:hypothetical protein